MLYKNIVMLWWLHIFVEIRMLFTVLQSIYVWKVTLKTYHANFVSQIRKSKYNTLFSLSEVPYLIGPPLTHWPWEILMKFQIINLQLTLVIDGWCISCEIALRWLLLDLNDDKSTSVQLMAWCCQAKKHYLSHCWPRFRFQYVTVPHWDNKCHSVLIVLNRGTTFSVLPTSAPQYSNYTW